MSEEFENYAPRLGGPLGDGVPPENTGPNYAPALGGRHAADFSPENSRPQVLDLADNAPVYRVFEPLNIEPVIIPGIEDIDTSWIRRLMAAMRNIGNAMLGVSEAARIVAAAVVNEDVYQAYYKMHGATDEETARLIATARNIARHTLARYEDVLDDFYVQMCRGDTPAQVLEVFEEWEI